MHDWLVPRALRETGPGWIATSATAAAIQPALLANARYSRHERTSAGGTRDGRRGTRLWLL
jgi:hypothetical protein